MFLMAIDKVRRRSEECHAILNKKGLNAKEESTTL
jgi:hypothetical protein